jgi:hypothetical protein
VLDRNFLSGTVFATANFVWKLADKGGVPLKQCDMTLEQAKELVNELGFARLTEPRARDMHPNEPVPEKARRVRLPRKWRGREAVLHDKLNNGAILALQAARRTATPIECCELDLMIAFAKKVKLMVKPDDAGVAAKANAA